MVEPIYFTLTAELEARFWTKTNKRGIDECWLWTGNLGTRGYGKIVVAGRRARATHVSLAIDGRPRPLGAIACHKCDNPQCVNPAHLWWGSNSDNSWDCSRKGRKFRQNTRYCINGHEYTPDNTYYRKRYKSCWICIRANNFKNRPSRRADKNLPATHNKDQTDAA